MEGFKLLNYIHFADSAWPVGSFAYSSGLEAMAKYGQLQTIGDLENYLDASLDQWLAFDIHILYSIFTGESEEALHQYHLCTRTPSIRQAAETQGRTWLRLIKVTHPSVNTSEIESFLKTKKLKSYFIAIYAFIMKQLNYSIEEASELYLYTLQRDQVSSAIRLGLLGPSRAHAILSRAMKKIEVKFLKDEAYHYTKAVRILPISDVAQIAHTNLYSKLFRN